MSTHDLYTTAPAPTWQVPATGAARFSWELRRRPRTPPRPLPEGQGQAVGRQPKRIDWSLEVDPADPLGTPDEALTLYGTPHWDKMTERDRGELRKHYTSWQFSQFLHGEQGAMVCAPASWSRCRTWTRSSTPRPRPWTRRGTPRSTRVSCTRRSGCSTRSTTTSWSLLGDTLSDARWDISRRYTR